MILHGRPLGGGAVIGTIRVIRAGGWNRAAATAAAHPRTTSTEVTADADGLDSIFASESTVRSVRRRDAEPPDIILVAPNIATAGASVGEGRIVGMVFEEDLTGAECEPLPVVAGVPELLKHARDGALALVDADRGMVILDPSPEHLAHFQALQEHIAPRYRIHLDHRHVVAYTVDMRPVHVVADARNLDDVRAGVDEGADELLFPLRALPEATGDSDTLFDALCATGEAAAGKPIILYGEVRPIPISSIMRAAARAQISYALPLCSGPRGFQSVREEMASCAADLMANDIHYLPFALAATTTEADTLDDQELGDLNLSRVIAQPSGQRVGWDEATAAWLAGLALLLRPLMVPLLAAVPEEALEAAVQCGASGLIVPPSRIQVTKTRIRDMGPF